MNKWQVIVGNIGTVFDGDNGFLARNTYSEYVSQSKSNYGRAAGECVTLMRHDDIRLEYIGTLARELRDMYGD